MMKTKTLLLAGALVAVGVVGSVAWALTPISSTTYKVNDATLSPTAGQLESTNYTVTSRLGPAPNRLQVVAPTSVQDWQTIGAD